MDDPVLERTVPAVLLDVLADELATRGLRLVPLLERAGLQAGMVGPDGDVPVAVFGRVIGEATALDGCRDLALRVGTRCGLRWAGPIGVAARHAATLGEALADLERLPELHDTIGSLSLVQTANEAHFTFQLEAADLPNAPLLYEIALGMMSSALRELTDGAVVPWIVRLPFRQPRDLAPYRQYLGRHLKFDAVIAELVFDADALAHARRAANPVLRRVALAQGSRQTVRREPLICVSVRGALQAELSRGTGSRTGVAAHLGMHERAMGRRLQHAGTSFQALLDREREIRARLLLEHTRVSVERIGRALGYRDSTVFGRAFRRWTCLLPGQFRAQFVQPPIAIATATATATMPPKRNTGSTAAGLAIQ
jgi:AraC-like DNA-binding protein